jgi:hypothetical protein
MDTAMPRLRAIARFWDVDLASERRHEAAAQLAEAMARPEVVADARAALPDAPRRALEALLAGGGWMPQRIFSRRWGEIRAMGPGRMERERPWREPSSPAEALWYTGFISRAFEQGDEGTYEVIFVPPELLALLPAAGATPPAGAPEPVPEPAAVRPAADAFLDDACTLVSYLQNERLRPAADGTWPARHEANLKRRLFDPDLTRLDLLRHLVQRLGWLRRSDSDRLRPDPAPVTSWLQSSPDEQRRALAEAWRDDASWNDLFHVPALEPVETGAWRNDPLLARQGILRHLRACAPGTWYALDGFVSAVKQAEPDFQRPDGDYTSWYIRDAVTGAYHSGFESWDAVEGTLIRSVIAGPLAWLGLTDVGAAGLGDPPSAFRITPAGAAFLGLAGPPPAQPSASLALRPDFTVLAPAARRYERFQLSRVAEWVRTGDPFVYRITPASLDRARQQGIPVARVLDFLAQATGAPVPHAVEAALTRWEVRGAQARIERVILLRLSSEDLMAQVASSPATRRLIQEQVGPAAALVREADWPRLVAALGEMGLLPDVAGLEENDR